MATVVNGTTGLGRIMNCTQVLPFRSTHFRTSDCGARRSVGEERNDDVIGFDGEEAAELVQPEVTIEQGRRFGAVYLRRGSKFESCVARDGLRQTGSRVAGEAVVER